MRYFDLHCDTVSEACKRSLGLDDASLLAGVSRCAGLDARTQFFALFIEDEDDAPQQTCARYLAYYKAQAQRLAHAMAPCVTAADMRAAHDAGKCAGVLTLENARALGGDLSGLETLAKAGVKSIGITWNAGNEFACGAAADGPLKPAGRELVRRMAALGVTPDVSHLCDASLNDLLRRFDAPVAATHSNLRSVCAHRRNLTDDQFREIASRGGVAGLNFYEPFVCARGAAALDDLLRHADRMLSLGGERSVCIGADFDGGGSAAFCRDAGGIPALYEAFLPRFGRAVSDGIFYDNAARFYFGE